MQPHDYFGVGRPRAHLVALGAVEDLQAALASLVLRLQLRYRAAHRLGVDVIERGAQARDAQRMRRREQQAFDRRLQPGGRSHDRRALGRFDERFLVLDL